MVQIDLTLKEIYEVLCPKCRKKVLDLAVDKGAKAAVRESIEESLQEKSG